MAVLKKIDVPFTQVANEAVDELELDELGALVKMLRKPADWKFSHQSLKDLWNVGEVKVKGIVRRLKEIKVLDIYPDKDPETGLVREWIWQVSAMPLHQYQNDTSGEKSTSIKNQQLDNDTAYKIKNLKNKDSSLKKKRAKKEAVKIPEDFELTDALLDWMAEKTPQLDPLVAFADFKEFWQVDGGTKKDWLATFKKAMLNYVSWRKCLKDKGDQNGNGKQENGDQSNDTRGHRSHSGDQANGTNRSQHGSNKSADQGSDRKKLRVNPIILS